MADPITVPLLDLKVQYATIRDEIEVAMHGVLESQWFVMGPEVSGLEAEIAEYVGTKHAVGCASGSDALLLALLAIGVGPGDEVICPSYTFFATGSAVHRLGATPVFVDIDPVTYNFDLACVAEAAERCPRLKAIMPVHLFGRSVEMDALTTLAERSGVPVIEDAAQAIGSCDPAGHNAGARGAIGCFSFFPTKNLGGFGEGGICTTDDGDLARDLELRRVHGMEPKYYHRFVGMNSRLDALQAAVLRVKLRHLDAWTAGRQANAAFYDQAFGEAGAAPTTHQLSDGGLPVRTPAPVDPDGDGGGAGRHIYNQYVIRVPAGIRDAVRAGLADRGVGSEIYYPVPLHMQECFQDLGVAEGALPHTELAAKETIALPIYPELTEEQLAHVVSSVVDLAGRPAVVNS